jgi:hypothetical protein
MATIANSTKSSKSIHVRNNADKADTNIVTPDSHLEDFSISQAGADARLICTSRSDELSSIQYPP